jgi:hypothetical protein
MPDWRTRMPADQTQPYAWFCLLYMQEFAVKYSCKLPMER